MFHVEGFGSLEEAKRFLESHNGKILWEERTPIGGRLTLIGRAYLIALELTQLDKNRFPYLVEYQLKED